METEEVETFQALIKLLLLQIIQLLNSPPPFYKSCVKPAKGISAFPPTWPWRWYCHQCSCYASLWQLLSLAHNWWAWWQSVSQLGDTWLPSLQPAACWCQEHWDCSVMRQKEEMSKYTHEELFISPHKYHVTQVDKHHVTQVLVFKRSQNED